jgi:hypothetical protein
MLRLICSLFIFVNNKIETNIPDNLIGVDSRHPLIEINSCEKILENLNKKTLLDKLENKNYNKEEKLKLITDDDYIYNNLNVNNKYEFNILKGGLMKDCDFDFEV